MPPAPLVPPAVLVDAVALPVPLAPPDDPEADDPDGRDEVVTLRGSFPVFWVVLVWPVALVWPFVCAAVWAWAVVMPQSMIAIRKICRTAFAPAVALSPMITRKTAKWTRFGKERMRGTAIAGGALRGNRPSF